MKIVKVVERYYKNESIILWNVWNEPRNKPIEECFCEHCRKGFGKFLEEKFETVEKLNQFYGATEESFETVNLPAMPHGYWDMFEFKKFKAGTGLRDTLRFVYDEIRKYDKKRPIMSHVGYTSAFQSALDDCCDDYTVSEAVDFWGTSIPCDTTMDTHEKRMDFQMLNDFLRSVDENYFLHEIYPGLGMFWKYDTNFDMNFKLYSALAAGAKGLTYWQYRAERVGYESDCSGIMHMDGSPREVAYEVKDFGAQLKKDNAVFKDSKAKPAEIAIVFDYDCLLLSEIEDSCGPDYTFGLWNARYHYKNAHTGMYRLLRDANYAVDYVGVRDVQKFDQYKVLYLPYYTMIKPDVADALKAFIEKGGMMIHFGLYSLLAGEWKGKRTDMIAEWAQSCFQIPIKEYEKLMQAFNPVFFDADEWCDLAASAGMKYIVVTTKHHEGFALFDSKVDDYNVMHTPFGRDIIKELSVACRNRGLKFGIYYSQELDWHEEHGGGYTETFETNQGKPWTNTWDFPNTKKDFEICFRKKTIPQVTELLTNYGDIDLIWFDTPQDITKEQSIELYNLVKKYQPNCLINSRIGNGMGDYGSSGDNDTSAESNGMLYEVPATLNDTWGYKAYDQNWKDAETVLKIKNELNSRGINYLLNVGPDALGRIPAPSELILREVGKGK